MPSALAITTYVRSDALRMVSASGWMVAAGSASANALRMTGMEAMDWATASIRSSYASRTVCAWMTPAVTPAMRVTVATMSACSRISCTRSVILPSCVWCDARFIIEATGSFSPRTRACGTGRERHPRPILTKPRPMISKADAAPWRLIRLPAPRTLEEERMKKQHMNKPRTALIAIAAVAALAFTGCSAQSGGDSQKTGGDEKAAFSDVSIVVPADPGGGWDQTGRTIAKVLTEQDIVKTAPVTN